MIILFCNVLCYTVYCEDTIPIALILHCTRAAPVHNNNVLGYLLYDPTLGLSDYRDSTRHRDSLGQFTIVIVDCLTI